MHAVVRNGGLDQHSKTKQMRMDDSLLGQEVQLVILDTSFTFY